jgi:hypothetical protein
MREAEQIEARLREEVGAGRHRGSRSRAMAELLERWLEWRPTVRPIAPTTVASYRAAMDRYILPALGKLPVRQVEAATLDAFYARLRTRGGKDGRPQPGEVGDRPIGPNGRRAAAAGPGRRPAPVGGQRGEPGAGPVPAPGRGAWCWPGEICSLRWPDIDLDRGEVLIAGNVVRVPSKPSSTRTPRPMPSVGWRSAPARSSCCGPAGSPKPRMPWPAGRRGGRRPCVLPRPGRLEADRHGHPARGRGSGLAHRLGPGWPRRRPYDHGHLRPPPTGPGPAGGRGHGRVVSDR